MISRLAKRLFAAHVLFVLLALALTGCATTGSPQLAGYQPPTVPLGEKTALDNYVAAPDPNYSYKVVNTLKGEGYTAFIVEMISQQYLTEKEVDKPIWKHYLTIIKPDNVKYSTGLLYITGGGNDKPAPDKADGGFVKMAMATQSVCAELRQVPSEPLVFSDDNGRKRSEDEIIAYTWDKYMRTGDEKWPLRLPMTKSAVRAMDTITSVCASPEAGSTKVDTFMVAGGSKRGWTTWTTAAVDKRVVAITPFVINMLNVVPSFMHHWQAYGFWAPAVGDYEEMGIMNWTNTPEYAALMRIEEPFSYRARLTMPKYIVNACGDQFFLPDSSQFYFDALPGVKYLRYVPNADHGLKETDAHQSLTTFYMAILKNFHLPQFSWTLEGEDAIRVTAKDTPNYAMVWQATNPEARDFRLETLGSKWQNTMLTAQSKGNYLARVPKPAKGWTAFFVELSFPSSSETPDFKFTTQVRVVPDVLPYKFTPKGRPQ